MTNDMNDFEDENVPHFIHKSNENTILNDKYISVHSNQS